MTDNNYYLESVEPDEPDKIVIWKGQLIEKFNTDYCDITLLKTKIYGNMLFMDNCLQSTENDEHIYHTALVHPLAEYSKQLDNVLILGGGEGCTAREILKYDPQFVLQIDIDHTFVKWASDTLKWDDGALKDPRVHLVYDDAWTVLKKEPYVFYDYIIVDLFDPTEQSADYFCELLCNCSKWLNKDGYLVAYVGMYHTLNPVIYTILDILLEKIGDKCNFIDYYTACIPSFGGDCVFLYYCLKNPEEEENNPHLAIDVS